MPLAFGHIAWMNSMLQSWDARFEIIWSLQDYLTEMFSSIHALQRLLPILFLLL